MNYNNDNHNDDDCDYDDGNNNHEQTKQAFAILFASFVVAFFCIIPKICSVPIGYFIKVKIQLNLYLKKATISRVRHPQSVFLTLAFFMSVWVWVLYNFAVCFYGQIKNSLIVEMEQML